MLVLWRCKNITKKYRKVKCAECKEDLDRNSEPFVIKSSKNYHEKCFNMFAVRKTHREELIEYITHLYGENISIALINKQIKDFQDQYNYTLKGMELALRYFHDIEGNQADAKGIGIIPFIYNDAKNYHIKMNKITKAAISMNGHAMKEIEVIRISPNKKRAKKIIDIGEL